MFLASLCLVVTSNQPKLVASLGFLLFETQVWSSGCTKTIDCGFSLVVNHTTQKNIGGGSRDILLNKKFY
jgi:hypothetical protein